MEKNAITKKVKIIPIGNSKGIRLPRETLQKYGFSGTLMVEEREDGVLLHRQKAEKKLSWEETFKAMAKEKEDWDDFETATLDGLEGDGQ